MRTPAGSVVTVTGDLVAACLTVTIDAPLALPGAAATFRTAMEKQVQVSNDDWKTVGKDLLHYFIFHFVRFLCAVFT